MLKIGVFKMLTVSFLWSTPLFFLEWESEMYCPGTATWGNAGSWLERQRCLPLPLFPPPPSLPPPLPPPLWGHWSSLLGQSREKGRRRSLPRSQTLVGQPLREGWVEPALEAQAQPAWWGDCRPKKRVQNMTAEEMFFRTARGITSCFSEIFFFFPFFAPFCLFLFGVKVRAWGKEEFPIAIQKQQKPG